MPVFVFIGNVFERSDRLQKRLPKGLRDNGVGLVDAIEGFYELTVTEPVGLVPEFRNALFDKLAMLSSITITLLRLKSR